MAAKRRTKPGSNPETGDYYHVTVRPKSQFDIFRTHDVGRKGHSQRVAGKRDSGSWATQKWLISKKDARVRNGTLVATDKNAKEILGKLRGKIKRVKGDIFEARKNVAEKDKPTAAQKRAMKKNIKKARKSRKR